jgi:hypothetical protein
MTIPTFDIGTRVVITGEFTDVAGAADDPSEILFSLKAPDGTIVTADETAATNPTTGTWSWTASTLLDQHGTWVARVAGTAGLETAAELKIRVRDSAFD